MKKELANKTVSIRTIEGEEHSNISLEKFIQLTAKNSRYGFTGELLEKKNARYCK